MFVALSPTGLVVMAEVFGYFVSVAVRNGIFTVVVASNGRDFPVIVVVFVIVVVVWVHQV